MNVSLISSNWSRFFDDLIHGELMSLNNYYTHTLTDNIDPVELSLCLEVE